MLWKAAPILDQQLFPAWQTSQARAAVHKHPPPPSALDISFKRQSKLQSQGTRLSCLKVQPAVISPFALRPKFVISAPPAPALSSQSEHLFHLTSHDSNILFFYLTWNVNSDSANKLFFCLINRLKISSADVSHLRSDNHFHHDKNQQLMTHLHPHQSSNHYTSIAFILDFSLLWLLLLLLGCSLKTAHTVISSLNSTHLCVQGLHGKIPFELSRPQEVPSEL